MTRLENYAEDQKIANIDQFPVYFRVEVSEVPDIASALDEWLLREGFRKSGHGRAATGQNVFESYSFADTFEMTVGPVGRQMTQMHGYGISTAASDAAPVLRRFLLFLKDRYKIQDTETKGL